MGVKEPPNRFPVGGNFFDDRLAGLRRKAYHETVRPRIRIPDVPMPARKRGERTRGPRTRENAERTRGQERGVRERGVGSERGVRSERGVGQNARTRGQSLFERENAGSEPFREKRSRLHAGSRVRNHRSRAFLPAKRDDQCGVRAGAPTLRKECRARPGLPQSPDGE